MISSSQRTRRSVGGIAGAVVLAGVAVAVLAPPHTSNVGRLAPAPPAGFASPPLRLAPAAGAQQSAPPPAPVAGPVGGAKASSAPSQDAAAPPAVPASGGAAKPPATAGSPAARNPAIGSAVTQPAPPPDSVVRSGILEIEVAKRGFSSAFSAAADVARQMGGFVVIAEMGPTATPVPAGQPLTGAVGLPNPGRPVLPPSPAPGGGQIGPSAPTGSGAPTSGTLELRVPGARFDDGRRQLEGLGRVRQEQLSGQDAGGQLADFGARLADLRAEQDGLRGMAAKAATSGDLLAINAQLAAVQQQIDGLGAQVNTLNNRVALASITVTVHEPVASAPGAPSILSARLAQARRGVEAVVGGIVVVLAYGAPIGLLAGLGGLVIAAQRRRRLARAATTM